MSATSIVFPSSSFLEGQEVQQSSLTNAPRPFDKRAHPIFCYKCLLPGHMKGDPICKSLLTDKEAWPCIICSETHVRITERKCEAPAKCSNCTGTKSFGDKAGHRTDDYNCPYPKTVAHREACAVFKGVYPPWAVDMKLPSGDEMRQALRVSPPKGTFDFTTLGQRNKDATSTLNEESVLQCDHDATQEHIAREEVAQDGLTASAPIEMSSPNLQPQPEATDDQCSVGPGMNAFAEMMQSRTRDSPKTPHRRRRGVAKDQEPSSLRKTMQSTNDAASSCTSDREEDFQVDTLQAMTAVTGAPTDNTYNITEDTSDTSPSAWRSRKRRRNKK